MYHLSLFTSLGWGRGFLGGATCPPGQGEATSSLWNESVGNLQWRTWGEAPGEVPRLWERCHLLPCLAEGLTNPQFWLRFWGRGERTSLSSVCVCVFGEENKQVGLAPWIVRWSREWRCSGLSGSGPGRAASNGDPGAGTLAGKKVGKVWYSRESPDQLKHAPHLLLL